MSDPKMIKEIKNAVTIPVMAKVRIGHFVEAQVIQRSDYIYILLRHFPLLENIRFTFKNVNRY